MFFYLIQHSLINKYDKSTIQKEIFRSFDEFILLEARVLFVSVFSGS
jgi:hypothetical protein